MFADKYALIKFMTDNGADRILFKCLAENDNNKQQIYPGGSFEALHQIPVGEIIPDNPNGKVPNYKAALNFYWISHDAQIESPPRAQLILYPEYPEIRLSGFLQGCRTAPRGYLQPVPSGARRYNNGKDGRFLVLRISTDGCILACLVPAETHLANELASTADDTSVFTNIDISGLTTKQSLLSKINEIKEQGSGSQAAE